MAMIIYGNGRMASLAHYYLTHDSTHTVEAFTVERAYLDAPSLHGLPVVPLDELAERFPPTTHRAFVAMGYRNLNRDREQRYLELKGLGYDFVSYVSSMAMRWPDVEVGDNCFIMEGNVIQPFVSIGHDVTMGPANTIGHHSRIMDHCFLASRVDVSGHVTIGQRTFVGANATIRNAVTIADDCVIGAAALVMSDTRGGEAYRGHRAELLPIPSGKLPRI